MTSECAFVQALLINAVRSTCSGGVDVTYKASEESAIEVITCIGPDENVPFEVLWDGAWFHISLGTLLYVREAPIEYVRDVVVGAWWPRILEFGVKESVGRDVNGKTVSERVVLLGEPPLVVHNWRRLRSGRGRVVEHERSIPPFCGRV